MGNNRDNNSYGNNKPVREVVKEVKEIVKGVTEETGKFVDQAVKSFFGVK